MPILTVGQLVSRATELSLGRGDWTLSDATFWLNQAYSQMVAVVGHTPLEALAVSSTTSGEARYALPLDFGSAIAVTLYAGSSSTDTGSHYTSVIPLRQQDARWMDAQTLVNNVSPGVPSDYMQFATWLELYPSPNSVYSVQLRYNAKPSTLVNSSDTPALDERWQLGLIFKTNELLEASRGNVEYEAMARNRYLDFMNTQPSDRALKHRDRTNMGLRYARKLD
jgi:hypothetical protein